MMAQPMRAPHPLAPDIKVTYWRQTLAGLVQVRTEAMPADFALVQVTDALIGKTRAERFELPFDRDKLDLLLAVAAVAHRLGQLARDAVFADGGVDARD